MNDRVVRLRLDSDNELTICYSKDRRRLVFVLKKQVLGEWRTFPTRECPLGYLIPELGIQPLDIAVAIRNEFYEDDSATVPADWRMEKLFPQHRACERARSEGQGRSQPTGGREPGSGSETNSGHARPSGRASIEANRSE